MDIACLLLHGFGGSPFELEYLKSVLEQNQIQTCLPCLPGHNTSLKDFSQTRYQDWLQHAEKHLLKLKAKYSTVFVLGFSMGGTLGLDLACRHEFAGLIIIAAPVFLIRFFPPVAKDWRLLFLPVLKRIKPIFPIKPPHPKSRQIAPWQGYEGYVPLHPLHSFVQAMKSVRTQLSQITCPSLFIYSTTDKTVPVENSFYILKRIKSNFKELVLLTIEEKITSAHLLPTHQETKEIVAQKILQFLNGQG